MEGKTTVTREELLVTILLIATAFALAVWA